MSHQQTQLDKLVSHIYEAAVTPEHWPELVSALYMAVEEVTSSELDETVLPRPISATNTDRTGCAPVRDNQPLSYRLTGISEHFNRALTLSERSQQSSRVNDVLTTFIDQIPLGVLIVESDGRLLFHNRHAEEQLKAGVGLQLSEGYVVASGSRLNTQDLIEAIAEVIDDANLSEQGGTHTIKLSSSDSLSPCSVMVTRSDTSWSNQPTAMLLIASSGELAEPNIDRLQALFNLTLTEARLVTSLVRGQSLDDYAKQSSVSINTVRTHLRRVFDKTGTHRQTELVVKILSGPAMLAVDRESSGMPLCLDSHLLPNIDNTIILDDGRQLAYAEFGCADGYPILFFHSINGCRLQQYPDNGVMQQLGLKMIGIDRPGIGNSTLQPGRRLIDWPHDVAALVDHLNIERFSVMGASLGGAHAIVCGALLGDRIDSVSLVGSVAPFQHISELKHIQPTSQMAQLIGRYTPSLMKPMMYLLVRGIMHNPDSFFELTHKHASSSEKEFADAVDREHFFNLFWEAIKGGSEPLAQDLVQASQPWEFEVEDIAVPVHIWHGDEDTHVAIKPMQRLAAKLPNCHTHYIDGEGHYLFARHWPQLLTVISQYR